MKISLDIRDIILTDPGGHLPVYDQGEKGTYVSSITENLEMVSTFQGPEKRYCSLEMNSFKSIDEIQKYLAISFISAANLNKNNYITDATKLPGTLYKQKYTKNYSVLMHLNTFRYIDCKANENRKSFGYGFKKDWHRLCQWLSEREFIVLNDYIPTGQIIGTGPSELVGRVTYDGVFLDRISIGVWPDTITTCVLKGDYADL